MGTVGNRNPWAPYESYRDCSQGICSIYCPQWCYFFPPPPPLELEDDSGTAFSPLIIAVISILASAFLLVSYYTIITKYCGRRNDRNSNTELETNRDQIVHDQLQVGVTGLDETTIKSITVCKYIKGDGLIEGTECAVCLNEFQENESLRLLPKCTHAFHLPCIDTWLKTHSNCPLCRSSAAPISPPPPPPPPPPAPSSQTSSSLNISSLEIQRQSDLVLVVEDCERIHREEVDYHIQDDLTVENAEIRSNVAGNDQENAKHFRRSISLGRFSRERDLSIAEILQTDEDDDLQGEIRQSWMGIGSSQDCPDEQSKSEPIRSCVEMKRSVSTGRLIVTHDDKGKNAIDSQLKIQIK